MSASLVGSEMCIRDRDFTRNRAEKASTDRRLQDRRRQPHGVKAEAQPVSYTHLTLPTICSV
eukprot:14981909-Alexandrium_andersonii.AAC.1